MSARCFAIGLVVALGCSAAPSVDSRASVAAGGSAATPAKAGAGATRASAANDGFDNASDIGSASGTSGTSTFPTSPANNVANAILTGSCATASMKSALLPADILFVIDRSGSMNCNPPPATASPACEAMPVRADASAPSKWEITADALSAAVKTLPPSVSLGISYFSNDSACGVNSMPSVPVASNTQAQQAAIQASLHSVMPGGGTPIVGATILAYKHMHQLALAGSITGNPFIVLITDGQQSEQCANPPVCADAQSCVNLLVQQEVPKAAGTGAGIRTFVIGAPGSEPARTVLSQIAKNGGTGAPGCDPAQGNCHFDMTTGRDFGAGLSKALADIIGQTLSCELPVPVPADGKPLALDRVNVVFTPAGQAAEVISQDTRASCDGGANGWQYNGDNSKIRLCGAICDRVRADQGGRLDVVLGCLVQGPQ